MGKNLNLFDKPEMKKYRTTKNVVRNSYKIAEVKDATKQIHFDIWNHVVKKSSSLKRREENKNKKISTVTMKLSGKIKGEKFSKEITISKGTGFKQNMARAVFGTLHSMNAFNSKYKNEEEQADLNEKGYDAVEDFGIEFSADFY
tara:strand:+ start:341 stop:775 length:435 start_codon:yes stop_codon:yes gene_type:complete